MELIPLNRDNGDLAYNILVENSEWLNKKNIDLWRRPYPRQKFDAAVDAGEVYGVFLEESIIGTVTLSKKFPDYCPEDAWETETQEFWYMSRLAVSPRYRGMEYGRRMLDLIETSARKRKIYLIRLDCSKKVPFLLYLLRERRAKIETNEKR